MTERARKHAEVHYGGNGGEAARHVPSVQGGSQSIHTEVGQLLVKQFLKHSVKDSSEFLQQDCLRSSREHQRGSCWCQCPCLQQYAHHDDEGTV